MTNKKIKKELQDPSWAPRPKRKSFDVDSSLPKDDPPLKSRRVVRKPEAAQSKSLHVRKVPIDIYNQVLDMIYTKRTSGENIMASTSTVITEALHEYFDRHKPRRMPDAVRKSYIRDKGK